MTPDDDDRPALTARKRHKTTRNDKAADDGTEAEAPAERRPARPRRGGAANQDSDAAGPAPTAPADDEADAKASEPGPQTAGDEPSTPEQAVAEPPRPVTDVESTEGREEAASAAMREKALARAKLVLPQERDGPATKPAGLSAEQERRARIAAEARANRSAALEAAADDHERDALQEEWEIADQAREGIPTDHLKEVEVYPIQEPFSYVQILYDEALNEFRYHVVEPMLSDEEALLLGFIERTIVDVLDVSPRDQERADLDAHLEGLFEEVLHDYSIVFTPEPEGSPDTLALMEAAAMGDDEGDGAADEEARPGATNAPDGAPDPSDKKAVKAAAKAAKQAQRLAAKAAKDASKAAGKAAKKNKGQPGSDADAAGVRALDDEEDVARRIEMVRQRLLYYVKRDFLGEGPIDVMMQDDMIEDVSCNGPHEPLFVYHRKHESMQTTVKFRGHDHLDGFVIRLAQRSGKHVSIAEPIVDATMMDGSRLQATFGREVSSFGSTFTIRKFRETPLSPIDLVRFGTMDPRVLAYIWLVIQHRASGMFAGGTASGKTTALNACTLFIPPNMKVVSIEDTREIQIPQPNWIAGITRGGFGPRDAHGRQSGEIDMFQLLKNALRQRPEYIMVGEVRGAEAYNLFQAMATGHAAYGTLHADSVDAVIHRLESDPINIPRPLLEALDIICVQILTRVGALRVRRTKSVTELVGLDPNTKEILTNEVFRWDPGEDSFVFTGTSYNLRRIAIETGTTEASVHEEWARRTQVIEYLLKNKMHDYQDVHDVVNAYYKRPDPTYAIIEANQPWR